MCTTVAAQCDEHFDPQSCESAGCTWNDSLSACQATQPATTVQATTAGGGGGPQCGEQFDQQSCEAISGCAWDGSFFFCDAAPQTTSGPGQVTTGAPTTGAPTQAPSSSAPVTAQPSQAPTSAAPTSVAPTSPAPTLAPTSFPTHECSPKYQCTRVSITAEFTAGGDASITLSVQDSIDLAQAIHPQSHFAVYNNSVVCGAEVGDGGVSLTQRGVALGSITLTVSRQVVSVVRLHVLVVASLAVDVVGPTVTNAAGLQTTPLGVSHESYFQDRLQRGEIYTQALTSDGELWPVMDFAAIRVDSGGVLSVTNGSHAVVQTEGSGNIVHATWVDACTGADIADGFGFTNASFQIPRSMSVAVSASEIALPADVAELAGIANQSTVRVYLHYADGSVVDATADPRVSFATVPSGTASVQLGQPTSHGLVVTAVAGRGAGSVTITARAAVFNLSSSIAVNVVGATGLSVRTVPYPTFVGSNATSASTIAPIAASGRTQMLDLHVTATLSNGQSVDISQNSRVQYTQIPAGLLNIGPRGGPRNRVVRTQVLSTGRVEIHARIGSVSGHTEVSTVSTPVSIRQILNLSVTLQSLVQYRLAYGVELSDGRQLPSSYLFPNSSTNVATIPGLVRFQSAQPSIVIIGQAGPNTVSVLGNHYAPVSIVAVPLPSGPQATTSVTPNMLPVPGEMDVGAVVGPAIPAQTVGAQITLPIRINLDGVLATSLHARIQYDPSKLTFASLMAGPQWGAHVFAYNIVEPGVLEFGGGGFEPFLLDPATRLFHIATVILSTRASGLGEIVGDIVTLADAQGRNVSSSIASAARVTFPIETATSTAWSPRPQLSRRPDCTTNRVGDVDSNCVLDIRDASALIRYILGSQTEQNAIRGQAAPGALDVNHDGTINSADVSILLQAQFGLAPVVQALTISPISRSSACRFNMSASIQRVTGTRGAVAVADTEYRVLFVLEKSGVNLTQVLTQSVLFPGQVVGPTADGGAVWAGGQTGAGTFVASAETSLTVVNMSVSLVLIREGATSLLIPRQRVRVFSGRRQSPFSFQQTTSFVVQLADSTHLTVQLAARNQYATVSNTLSSSDCVRLSDSPTVSPTVAPTSEAPTTLPPALQLTVEPTATPTAAPTVEQSSTPPVDLAVGSDGGGGGGPPIVIIAAAVGGVLLLVAVGLLVHSQRHKAFLRADEERALQAAESSLKRSAIVTNQMYDPLQRDSSPLLTRTSTASEDSDPAPPPAALPIDDDRTLLYFGEDNDVYHPGASATDLQREQAAAQESSLQLERTTQECSRWIDVLHSVFGGQIQQGAETSVEAARQKSSDLLATIDDLVSGASATTAVAQASAASTPFYTPQSHRGTPASSSPRATAALPDFLPDSNVCTMLGNCQCPNCR
eukprot:CAMPEP_0206306246 /NCGR_PEP_ID=MMETSP0106_2-20121207/10697_1 /ASSEMBLY_ACC=CAM_ASM_000206 /TAXON_ID=81532 /ORGANISM="Acanthoeca-like sp., Strain 10tr" /LENGTH=1386 /DNA_ID=CAMNT_0053737153 /DNA_START=1086 /DNA_END=5246 /DNA_ORIENTATION=-